MKIAFSSPASRNVCAPFIAATLAVLASPALAFDYYNGAKAALSINGQVVLSQQGGGPNGPGDAGGTVNRGGVNADLRADSDIFTSGKVELAGTGAAVGKVQANSSYTFKLKPPAGANVKGGKLVLHVLLEGSASGDADVHLVVAARSDFGKGEATGVISDNKTPMVEFDVVVPIAPFIENLALAQTDVHLHLDITGKLAGAGQQASSALASRSTRVTSFKVLDAAGVQVTGFSTDLGNKLPPIPESAGGPPPPVPPVGGTVEAIEFFNATFQHYFVSSATAEIAKLDDGTFAGWKRTGQKFNVHPAAAGGLAAVCRFFTVAFPPSSSHFYAPRGLGCEGTLTNTNWQYEGDVFYVSLPTVEGVCPSGTQPVYRLYNNGRGGAPNHRFTTSETTRSQMLAEGFVAEGAGPMGVGFCAPQ